MNYNEKAYEIIKDSIKSAIFIDEKARDFFQEDLKGSTEEQLSVDLYANFKRNGISLAIHKYMLGDELKDSLRNYLFEDRDLVLLDWNLQDNTGEEYSLKLLSDIVNRNHIHFCAIYTSESGRALEGIFYNILSYFSGKSKDYYDDIKEVLELLDNFSEAKDSLDYINIFRDLKESGRKAGELKKNYSKLVQEIQEITGESDLKCALIKASIATMNVVKSEIEHPCPDVTSFDAKTLVINNTIITLLNKGENDPSILLKNLSDQVANQNSSFTQLLGLEMQNIFSKNSSFIDANLLKVSKEALLFHREAYKKEDLEYFFPEFLKEVMLEKSSLNLRSHPFSLLDQEFLNSLNIEKAPSDTELIAMNVFYNSTKLRNGQGVNFGDVFYSTRDDVKSYYICITALCDCLRSHEKIENNFFFAKGSTIKKDKALKLGDSAFVSYLNNDEIVVWTDVATLDDTDNYKPKYIRPLSFNIANTMFDHDNKIEVRKLDSRGELVSISLTYVTTIKPNYTQRIANHAFSHPIRVGVDFVKRI